MTMNNLELALILSSILIGLLSAVYFYKSADIFTSLLQRPLKYISSGVILIMLGIFMAVFINFQYNMGKVAYLYHLPLNFFFFLLYIAGSILIFIGARKFSHRPA